MTSALWETGESSSSTLLVSAGSSLFTGLPLDLFSRSSSLFDVGRGGLRGENRTGLSALVSGPGSGLEGLSFASIEFESIELLLMSKVCKSASLDGTTFEGDISCTEIAWVGAGLPNNGLLEGNSGLLLLVVAAGAPATGKAVDGSLEKPTGRLELLVKAVLITGSALKLDAGRKPAVDCQGRWSQRLSAHPRGRD